MCINLLEKVMYGLLKTISYFDYDQKSVIVLQLLHFNVVYV